MTFRTAAMAILVIVAVSGCVTARPTPATTPRDGATARDKTAPPPPVTHATTPAVPTARPTATAATVLDIAPQATLDCSTAVAGVTIAQALDIAEATYRYQFEHDGFAQTNKNVPAYFLDLFCTDPTPAFLARFQNNKPPVRRGSLFAQGDGLRFRVDCIQRISDTEVQVGGGYYAGNLSASGNTYTVELEDGRWVVTGDSLNWIS
jgi:hypothetical protein